MIQYGRGAPRPPDETRTNKSHVPAVLPVIDYRKLTQWREASAERGRKELRELAKEGYLVQPFDGTMRNALHFRINGVLEIWPSRNRYRFLTSHRLKTGYRHGAVPEGQSITDFVHARLPLTPKAVEELRMDRELGL
jgi:hypothetical protein